MNTLYLVLKFAKNKKGYAASDLARRWPQVKSNWTRQLLARDLEKKKNGSNYINNQYYGCAYCLFCRKITHPKIFNDFFVWLLHKFRSKEVVYNLQSKKNAIITCVMN